MAIPSSPGSFPRWGCQAGGRLKAEHFRRGFGRARRDAAGSHPELCGHLLREHADASHVGASRGEPLLFVQAP